MVVGAGIAGLEAGVTAAQIGHQVEIYEKAHDIGGQIWIAGAPPHKQELLELIRYYRAMLRKYDIPVFLNSTVDAAFIRRQSPDYIVAAEGAKALLPPINGADDPSASSSWDVLNDNPPLGREVAVIGGGSVGLETALFVAAKGTLTPEMLHFLFEYEAESPERLRELMFTGTSHVTIFEMLPKPGKDHGKSTKWVLLGKLKRFGVEIITEATVQTIKNSVVTYEKNGEILSRAFDNIIVAAGSQAVQDLSKTLAPLNIPYTTIGDCVQPGKINDAVHGGFLAAMNI